MAPVHQMLTSESQSPVRTKAAAGERRPQDRVFHALRHDILLGRLRPRERLVEEELAARFDIGRYVVRTVLDELGRIGLVVRRPNRGVIVSDYDPAEIAKLYEVREILQQAAVARIPFPVPEELIRELRTINARYEDFHRRGELDEVAEANGAFHRTLFAACGNPYLAETIEQHRVKSAPIHGYAIGVPNLAAQSHRDHEEMIDCLVARDRRRLADVCTRHIQPTLELIRRPNADHRGEPVGGKA
jgi:DNA-binding GntR family transcriptional regulator